MRLHELSAGCSAFQVRAMNVENDKARHDKSEATISRANVMQANHHTSCCWGVFRQLVKLGLLGPEADTAV
jgi:hypothetical protein